MLALPAAESDQHHNKDAIMEYGVYGNVVVVVVVALALTIDD